MQTEKASIFTIEQEEAIKRLKAYFPYRICWGAVNNNGEFVTGADHTKQKLNSYLRKGWLVATV